VGAANRPVVLLVEDDRGLRRPLETILELRQFTVVTAETAGQGLDAIRHYRPAAGIIDLRLARGSGRDVIIAMPPAVPVIIFSGLPSEACELERLRPRTRLIVKPYSLLLLAETVQKMLEGS